MNSVNLIGRLTADPKIFITKDTGMKMAKFSIAINRIEKNVNEVDFINCFTIGKNAENVEKFLRKGSQIGASGQIRTGKYTKNSETRYSFEIFLEKIYFISTKNESMTTKNESMTTKNDLYKSKSELGNNWEIKNSNNFEQKNYRSEQNSNDFNQNNDEYFNEFNQYDGIDLSSDDLPF